MGRRIENERRIHVKFRIPILSLLVYLSASFVLQLINQWINQWINQSNIQSVNQSINQSINQAINQYIFLLPFVSCLFLSSLFLCPSHYLSNVVWFLFSYYTLLLFLNWLFRSLLSHNSLWISQQYQMFINGYLLATCWLMKDWNMFYWVKGGCGWVS
jgi:hypothetical protein